MFDYAVDNAGNSDDILRHPDTRHVGLSIVLVDTTDTPVLY